MQDERSQPQVFTPDDLLHDSLGPFAQLHFMYFPRHELAAPQILVTSLPAKFSKTLVERGAIYSDVGQP
jgi:hypothetical protein